MRRRHRGTTLIEIMVALAVATTVLVAARVLAQVLGESASRQLRVATTHDRAANAERALRQLVGNIEVSVDSGGGFVGGRTSARFRSWCARPEGWSARCLVTLRATTGAGSRVVSAELDDGKVITVRDRDDACELRYLASAEAGGRWFEEWGEGLSLPLALAIACSHDTLTARIGDRG